MKWALLFVTSVAPLLHGQSAEQHISIEAVRKSALAYSAGLPDFLCTETVRRYRNSTSSPEWSPMDTLTVQLSYFEHREEYKLLLINGQKTKLRYEEAGGSVSQGEFGSMLQEIFIPSAQAEFIWDSRSTLRARPVEVFRYSVKSENAHYRLTYTSNDRHFSASAGRHGLIYVDAAGQVLRITSEADHLPATFPIDRLYAVLDYESSDIGGKQFLVPHSATVEMRAGILGSKNEIEFHDYRKFSAEAGVSFDTQIKK